MRRESHCVFPDLGGVGDKDCRIRPRSRTRSASIVGASVNSLLRAAAPDPKRDPARKPSTLCVVPENLPPELLQVPQWIRWRWEWNEKRTAWTKIPLQSSSSRKAATNRRETWAGFQDALANVGDHDTDGIGFVFTEQDPYCGIDIDGCRNAATGKLSAFASEVLGLLASYAEVSATGTGVHIIVKAALPNGAGRKHGCLEIYDRGRYFAFTGGVLDGHD